MVKHLALQIKVLDLLRQHDVINHLGHASISVQNVDESLISFYVRAHLVQHADNLISFVILVDLNWELLGGITDVDEQNFHFIWRLILIHLRLVSLSNHCLHVPVCSDQKGFDFVEIHQVRAFLHHLIALSFLLSDCRLVLSFHFLKVCNSLVEVPILCLE